jgi:hypothetical protein
MFFVFYLLRDDYVVGEGLCSYKPISIYLCAFVGASTVYIRLCTDYGTYQVHCHVYNSSSLEAVLNQMTTVSILRPSFSSWSRLLTSLPSHLRVSPTWSSVTFLHRNVCVSVFCLSTCPRRYVSSLKREDPCICSLLAPVTALLTERNFEIKRK